MKKEIYELSSSYMNDLKKLLKVKKISQYDIAHASFRKNHAHWIIKSVDKTNYIITYLCGDTKQFTSYFKLMNEVRLVNSEYKAKRRKYITKYYNVINAFTRHRTKLRNRFKTSTYKVKSLANRLTPEVVKQLVNNI